MTDTSNMISIETLRKYFRDDQVFATEHASERYRQRGIRAKDVRVAIENGEIIEQYPDDFPYPSCLICGKNEAGEIIHVCMSDEGTASSIITAYYPDEEKWDADFRIRKEK